MDTKKNLIEVIDKDKKPLLILTREGEVVWGEGGKLSDDSFRNVIVYLFDIVYRQQATLHQLQMNMLNMIQEKPDAKKIIQLPH